MKHSKVVSAAFLAAMQPTVARAAAPETVAGCPLINGVIMTVVYSALGIVMALIAYRLIDVITPGNLSKELTEDHNVALGIVVGAMILGVCIIIAASMVG